MPNKDSEAALSTAKSIDRQSLAAVTPEPLRLGRGINLILTRKQLSAEIFELIKQVHFDHIRLILHPFRYMTTPEDNYRISDNWLDFLDWDVNLCLQSKLKVVISLHESWSIAPAPFEYWDQFISFWEQISVKFANYSNRVIFEILNEPHDELNIKTWNLFVNEALKVIRQTNPSRPVIIGPTHWNYITMLDTLEIPEEDCNLIITFHYYEPVLFTHQGVNAPWLRIDYKDKIGITWGTDEEKDFLIENFEKAHQWGIKHNRPLYLGEFGVSKYTKIENLIQYINFIRETAEKLNFDWSFFCFVNNDFGIFELQSKTWNKPLLKALIPDAPALKS